MIVTLLLKLCQQNRMEKEFAFCYDNGRLSDGMCVILLYQHVNVTEMSDK